MNDIPPPRSALFLPASNPRAIEKARGLACDMVLLDLEDAVKAEAKEAARAAAVRAAASDYGGRPVAIRLNGAESPWHEADVAAVRESRAALAVLPKAEDAGQAARLAAALGRPVLAMIETPAGVLAAPAIAAAAGVAGLIPGTNDLAAALHLPPVGGRAGLAFALQAIEIGRAHV